ncbi:MAG: helix-turn-helix domain-containing protein [Shewanella sp.]
MLPKIRFTHSKKVAHAANFIPTTVSVKRTLQVIASMCAPARGYTCFPKVDTIAAKTGQCRRTVFNHLRQLCELGVLKIRHRYRTCKKTNQARQQSSLYTIVVGRIWQLVHSIIAPKLCTPSFNHSKRVVSNKGAPNSVPYTSHQNRSSFNAARFDRENREHEARLAEMERDKVSPETAKKNIQSIWEMLGRRKKQA